MSTSTPTNAAVVELPRGFRAAGVTAGLKASGRPDLNELGHGGGPGFAGLQRSDERSSGSLNELAQLHRSW
jgi:hypothetical protein